MNITDIDDKIIKKANESNKGFRELSSFYENEFFEDMKYDINKLYNYISINIPIQKMILFIYITL